MLEKAKSAAKCRFRAEREFLCDLQDYPSPGMRVMQRVADAALAKGLSLARAAHVCGVLEHYTADIRNGSRTLDGIPLSVLVKIARFLDIEPFALLVASGHLRQGDFEPSGKRPPIEPYATDWHEWLQAAWVLEIGQLVADFGMRLNTSHVVIGLENEPVDGKPVPATKQSTAERGSGDYLREWLLDTCQARNESLPSMVKELGLHLVALGQFLCNTIEPGRYSRAQYERFANYLGVPVVCVLAAVDLLVFDERKVVSV